MSYKHGISSSDDIVIENGVMNITAVKDGLHANDYITLDGKNINITVNA
ncbi:MAG: carbohydrate-binding domain-containing protein, partial [Ruminococcus sp.]|nr:carbohydrate-binding domain-containing protein [Ruminococcus sp.]MBQ1717240.1 carbohydrate-binding domain-containing protein [Ruminococcus sp.]